MKPHWNDFSSKRFGRYCLLLAGITCLSPPAALGQTPPSGIATVFDATSFRPTWNRRLADVDGDRRADLVWRHGSNIFVRRSNGTGLGPVESWATWPIASDFRLADVNGDGRSDLVGRQADPLLGLGSYINVSLASPSGPGFLASTVWTYWNPAADYQLGDFDGDGKADLIGRLGTDLHVALSTGSSFRPSAPWTYWNPTADYKIGDFNRDGKADLIGRLGTNLHVALSSGNSFQASAVWTYWNTSADYFPADSDGDGRADVLGRLGNDVHVAISTGQSFRPSTVWSQVRTADDLLFGDLDADRKADLAVRRVDVPNGTSSLSIARSLAGGFAPLVNWLQEADRAPGLLGRISQAQLRNNLYDFCYRFGRRASIFSDHRESYSTNIEAAENYIVSKLRSYGYFVFVEPVYYNGAACLQSFCGNNIVALRPGFTVTSQFIDVTAHYDGGYHHLGDPNSDHFGAKDNASGVVSVLEIARAMRDVSTQHSIRFVFFAAEEVAQDAPGSLGFLQSPNGALDRTVMALNFDTVGTWDRAVTVWFRGQGNFDLVQLIAKQNQIYSLGATVIPSDISNDPEPGYRVQSDERSYNKEGRLAVTSLGGNWKSSGYHTVFDSPENVDFGNVYLATRLNLATLLALDVSARF